MFISGSYVGEHGAKFNGAKVKIPNLVKSLHIEIIILVHFSIRFFIEVVAVDYFFRKLIVGVRDEMKAAY